MRDSLSVRHEIFLATATVAAHATGTHAGQQGFRQKDVRFLVELFSNWTETSRDKLVLEIQNTQISRYLQNLLKEGYARALSKGRVPVYRLTRVGLIELLSRVVGRTWTADRQSFFFLHYFIFNYKRRITDLVRLEGRQFPPALRIELEDLLNETALLDREIEAVRKDLKQFDEGIEMASQTVMLVQRGLKQKATLDEMVAEAEEKYPYYLNNRKPLSELIGGIPEDARLWELSEGNEMRIRQIWLPGRRLLTSYLSELLQLRGAGGTTHSEGESRRKQPSSS